MMATIAEPTKSTRQMTAEELRSEAERLAIAIPEKLEELRKAVSNELGRRWAEQNREALEGWNRWSEKNGDPLAHLRAW